MPNIAEKAIGGHCIFSAMNRVLNGESLILTAECCGCRGFAPNAGFTDAKPNIPGGYELFLSTGAGEGFRPGERIKCSPELAAEYSVMLPKGTMRGFNAICVEPYQKDMHPELVMIFVTPDQLAGLSYLNDFRSERHDNAFLCTISGCASLFRVPFSELDKECPRAVVGALDIAARPYIDEKLLTFTVTGKTFERMLDDAEQCFFSAPYWSRLKKRMFAKSDESENEKSCK